MFMQILKEYYSTKEKPIILLVFLLISSILLIFFLPTIPEKFLSALIASFSIFTALLFNLLLLLINMIKNINFKTDIKSRKDFAKLKLDLMKKCLKIITASIFFSISDIVLLLIIALDYHRLIELIHNDIVILCLKLLIHFMTYLLMLLFFNSLYATLKIMHMLIKNEVENKEKEINFN